MKFWYEDRVEYKNDRVVVKLYDGNTFKKSIVIPTSYYPLNEKYEVFTKNNTEIVSDDKILGIFDEVKYKIGFCYSNSKQLYQKLVAQAIDAKVYCGWLFVGAAEYPVHHCWVVVNGKHLLDLGDDFTVMLSGQNAENFKNASIAETRRLTADFARASKNVPNRVRCAPVGTPTPFLLYVGCECDAERGREIYNQLLKRYPNHECERNCDRNGLNETQRIIRSYGVM